MRGNAAGKKEKKEPIVYNNIFDKGPACNSEGKTKKVRACCKYTIEHASDQLIALAPIFNAFFPWERNKQLELISSNKCSQYAPPKVGLGKKNGWTGKAILPSGRKNRPTTRQKVIAISLV